MCIRDSPNAGIVTTPAPAVTPVAGGTAPQVQPAAAPIPGGTTPTVQPNVARPAVQPAPQTQPAPQAQPAPTAAQAQDPGYIAPAVRVTETPESRVANVKEFSTKEAPEIRNGAIQGATIVDTKKHQQRILETNPEIIGLMTGTGVGYDELRNLVMYGAGGTGEHGTENSRQALGVALKKIGISDPRTLDALNQYDAEQARVNGPLIKQNLPGIQRITQGEFSFAKSGLLADIAKSTPAAVFDNNSREQFIGDLARAKGDYVTRNGITTATGLQSWNQEQDVRKKQYDTVLEARLKWINSKLKDQGIDKVPTSSNDIAYRKYVDTVMHSYKVYPTPEYNPQNHTWNFGTDQAKQAAKIAKMKIDLGR